MAGLIQTLEAERSRLKAEGNAINTLAQGAGTYTDEQRTRRDAIVATLAQLDSDISGQQALDAALREEHAVPADAEAVAAQAAANGGKAKKDPSPFASMGDFLQAVRASAIAKDRGMGADSRLLEIQAATGANETVGADGGFLVQKDLQSDLLTNMWAKSLLASKCRKYQVGPNSNGINFNVVDETSRATGSRWGGVQVYWTAEGATKTASRPKFKRMELQLQKLAGLMVATDELVQDSTSFAQFADEAFSEEMAFTLDDAIIRGTGVGMPLGILSASALVSASAEGGQAADSFVAENVWGMYARLPARSLGNAEWYINQALIPQIAQLQLAVGTGGVPLYIPAGGISQAPFGTLLGRPVNFIEQASAPGDLGDVILADLSEYMLIEKGGIDRASSIHVYFTTDETAFRWVWRVNGQPRWSNAITPYKGTPTVSPFVTLAAR